VAKAQGSVEQLNRADATAAAERAELEPGPTEAAAAPAPPPGPSVARQTVVYGIGELLSRLVSFLMIPLYTQFLTPADYGVVGLVDTALNLLAIVGGARLAAGIYRFYHKADDSRDRNAVISTALCLVAVTYSLLGAGVAVAAPSVSRLLFDSPEHATSLRIAAATFVAGGVIAVPSAFLVVTNRATMWVTSSLVKLVAHALLNVLLIGVLGMGLRGYFVSGLLIHVVFAAVLVVFQLRATGTAFRSGAARDLLRFWWPLIFTQLALFVITYGQRPILQRAAGTDAVGLFTLAYSFGLLVVSIGFSPFARVWDSVRFRYARLTDVGARDAAFARAFLDANVMLVTAAVTIVLFVGDFLRVSSRPAFHPAAALVPALVVAYVLQSWAMMQEVGILVSERTGYSTLANWVAGVVAIAGYFLLIPRYHAHGAAWATLGSMIARWVVTLASSQRLWPIRYEWAPVIRLVGLGALVSAAGLAVPATLPVLASIAVHGALFAVFVVALWNLGVIAEPVRARLRAVLRSPRAAMSGLLTRHA
jgi:O-antigen/teichoic acid export membrane protein